MVAKMKWHVISDSVRGASHIRNGLPNQDAVIRHPDPDSGLPIIMAVSDGHGSRKSFRSDRGSKFAVETALETIKEFVRCQPGDNFTGVKRIAEEQIPREIVKRWKQRVMADIRGCKDLECVDNPFIAYGATLLTVLVTESFIICFQLGDGDILTVWENDEVERPVPKDDRLFANETTSLCTKEAWRDFRFRFQMIADSPPKLILLATDGYANSFRDDESFMRVGSDIWHIIESEGPDFIRKNLGNWLNEATQAGSGDDITVGLICRQNTDNLREYKHFRIPLWIACPV